MGATTAIAVGSYVDAQGKKKQGEAFQQAGNAEQKLYEAAANDQIAASQRTAEEEARRSRLLQSRVLALSAASGGASDPTVQNIISGLAGEGKYQQMVALYNGESRAQQLRMHGAVSAYEGELAKFNADEAARDEMIAGGLRVGSSLYGKYGSRIKFNSSNSDSGFGP